MSAPPHGGQMPPQQRAGQNVGALQLANMAESVAECFRARAPPTQTLHAPDAETPPQQICVDQAMSSEYHNDAPPTKEETSAIKASLKELEASLAAMPRGEEFADIRDSLQIRIDAKKARLHFAKPIGVRLENAKSNLARATQKKEGAEKLLLAAQQAVNSSQADIDLFSKQIHDIEAELLASNNMAPNPPENPYLGVQEAMDMAIAALASLEGAHPEHLEQARATCAQVVQGFAAAKAHAEQQMKATDDLLADMHPTRGRRLPVGKANPSTGVDRATPYPVKPPTVVQGEKTLIKDIFSREARSVFLELGAETAGR